jgi:multiple sugar transport system ATP-binding protein
MAGVKLTQLSKQFGNVKAVDQIDLEIVDREMVVLVGPSGCGKTTTLRMIAGLEEASGGEIRIGDKVVNRVKPKDRNIAMVFQSYALYPHMNVYDNMAFGLKMRRTARTEIERRVLEASDTLGLADLLKRKPAELSGGQQQRVALGRAIVRDPAVFLFDEPLSNLDAKLRVKMRSELVKLHRRLEATMVYVTHDQVEAMMMGDRIVVMHEGRIQQVGPPAEVYERPANRFVAEFIGAPPMNLFDGVLRRSTSSQDAAAITTKLGLLDVPRARIDWSDSMDGREALLGLRPEDIHLGDNHEFCFEAEVLVAQPLGAETFVEFSSNNAEFIARMTGPAPPAGDKVRLSIDPDSVHLFDKQSEQRL